MLKQELIGIMKGAADFFNRSTNCLEESDAAFAPKEGMFSVVHHVAHVAQTLDWFFAGAFDPNGFDLNLEKHEQEVRHCTSLSAARQWFDKSINQAVEMVASKSEEEWRAPLPEGPVMGGLPRYSIIGAISDHTAHHRGALTVYSRLLGKTPAMPYSE